MGRNSVPRVRLREGTRGQGRRLPCVRPYRTQSLGLKIPAGACRKPFYCSEQPESGLSRQAGAQNALKWPKVTQNGSGRPPDRVPRGSPLVPTQQIPTTNCRPTITNRQLPTDTWASGAPKNNRKQKFLTVVPDAWGRSNGPTGQPTTTNRQPPATANRQLPSTADQARWGLKTVQNGNFHQWSPTLGEGQTDRLGPVRTRFQAVWPNVAQFLAPGSGDPGGW